ncbi:acetyl-CoA carboxylase, carboxyltransferase subunit beta [Methylacidiphilum caldifontis]|uniref:Acetyl-coenzyme A carboxylase carboxyl transferase subunit beta n=1 Tax=Methylacidiphilum caldifontis TaxID=2795386 RepID=A0A4Y8PJ28_9BACT|nr:acetyl-CoA carboxylase, carboxyltransferase subunit beta [Methylacidiphilum caldifontis]TFE71335.1 acetyl-CoA carboxylase subunit beta [Methylacidiphilum caldifontis]
MINKENKPQIPSGEKMLDIPEGLWTKCPGCNRFLYTKELELNQSVCQYCQHHFPIKATERIGYIADRDSFIEHDQNLYSIDILGFDGEKSYQERLDYYRNKTALNEAVVCGSCTLGSIPISLCVMDFSFLGGSMGSVVGEKITRAIERSLSSKLPLIIICASGGARMYEGMFSLMQMAKTAAALHRLSQARIPYISILTNPTMAGVIASFASLGDIILAEPKAMIGFAGSRVIKETTQQDLPPGFQTAEFLLEKGLIDKIVHRKELRSTLKQLLYFLK